MHGERRFLTTLIARDVTDPGPVPIRVLGSSLLMGGTDAYQQRCELCERICS